MPRVLFIERSLDPTHGGVERVSYILSEALAKKGYESYFLYSQKDSDVIPDKRKLKFNEGDDSTILFVEFSNFLFDKKIDFIICQNLHSPKLHDVYNRLKDKFSIKFITVLHSNPDIWVNKNKWGCTTHQVYIKEFLRSIYFLFRNPYKDEIIGMYELSDRFVLLSESFISVFKNLYKVAHNSYKLVAVPNPCSFSLHNNAVGYKENIVLVVSRMAEQQKRISNVLRIWKMVSECANNWKLILVGDGPDLPMYKKMAQDLTLKNVFFEGHSMDVSEFYKRSKIFLMTSIWEGLPMTLIEAQNYGCVPIAFDTYAALWDIIDNGQNGFIVGQHDIDRFCQKLILLMKNEDLCSNMAEKAMKNVRSKFDIDIITEEWVKLFNTF